MEFDENMADIDSEPNVVDMNNFASPKDRKPLKNNFNIK